MGVARRPFTLATLGRVAAEDWSGLLALAYVGSIPFDGYTAGGRSLPFWVGIAYVIARSADHAAGRAKSLPIATRPFAVAGAYVVLSSASIVWSVDPDLTIERAILLAQVLILTPLLAGDLQRVYDLVPATLCLVSAILAVFVLRAPENLDQRRSAFGDANEVAIMLFIGAACGTWICLRSPLKSIFTWLPITVLNVLAALTTGSRTALLGAAVAALALIITSSVKRDRRTVLAASLLIIVGATVGGRLPQGFVPDRLAHIDSAVTNDDLGQRDMIWTIATSKPPSPLGVGAAAAPTYLEPQFGKARVPHNVWIGAALETGLLGAILLLWCVCLSLWEARASVFSSLLVGLAPLLLVASIGLSLEGRRVFWVFLAMCWASAPAAETDRPTMAKSKKANLSQ